MFSCEALTTEPTYSDPGLLNDVTEPSDDETDDMDMGEGREDGRNDRKMRVTTSSEEREDEGVKDGKKRKAELVEIEFRPTLSAWRKYNCARLDLPAPLVGWERRKRKMMKIPDLLDIICKDGNCFFRAISREMTGDQKYHRNIREAIVQFMESNAETFKAYVDEDEETDDDKKFEKHLNCMWRDTSWATDAEILAAATLLETSIVVFTMPTEELDENTWQFYTYAPLFDLPANHAGPAFNQSIYLSLLDEHFERIIK